MRAASALLLLLAAACSGEPPPPPAPSLPTLGDTAFGRDCECMTTGRCAVLDAFEGESETRGFECRWQDRAADRALCSYESRSRHADPPGSPWSDWSRSTVRLRHLGDRGWCWDERW